MFSISASPTASESGSVQEISQHLHGFGQPHGSGTGHCADRLLAFESVRPAPQLRNRALCRHAFSPRSGAWSRRPWPLPASVYGLGLLQPGPMQGICAPSSLPWLSGHGRFPRLHAHPGLEQSPGPGGRSFAPLLAVHARRQPLSGVGRIWGQPRAWHKRHRIPTQ